MIRHDFDREWYEYLQRVLADREEAKRFLEQVIEQRDSKEDEDDG